MTSYGKGSQITEFTAPYVLHTSPTVLPPSLSTDLISPSPVSPQFSYHVSCWNYKKQIGRSSELTPMILCIPRGILTMMQQASSRLLGRCHLLLRTIRYRTVKGPSRLLTPTQTMRGERGQTFPRFRQQRNLPLDSHS